MGKTLSRRVWLLLPLLLLVLIIWRRPREPPSPPLSALGYAADRSYQLLPASQYQSTLLRFVEHNAPPHLLRHLQVSLATIPSMHRALPKSIWQTHKIPEPQISQTFRYLMESWRTDNPLWYARYFSDDEATEWVNVHLNGTDIQRVFNTFELGILRADLIRYLFLLFEGGVYTDLDTRSIRSIERWGRLPGQDHRGDANVVLAVESDFADDMPDWQNKGYSHPLQICQWTMLSAPFHPIFIDVVRRIVEKSDEIFSWEMERNKQAEALDVAGKAEEAAALRAQKATDRPLWDVVHWTGPDPFTDAVLSYLHVMTFNWTSLRGLKQPTRFGDVVIVPFGSFSGMYELSSSKPDDYDPSHAYSEHRYRGSWKGADWPWGLDPM